MGKIDEIQNLNISNTNTIINLINNNQSTLVKIANFNTTQYGSNIIHTVESDWVYLTQVKLENENGNIKEQYISFNTTFEQFPENLIPYISSIIIINQIDDLPFVAGGQNPRYLHPEDNKSFNTLNDGFVGTRYGDRTLYESSNVFQIEDIGDSSLKKVTLATFMIITGSSFDLESEEFPQFEGKLILTISNPNNFSRIA